MKKIKRSILKKTSVLSLVDFCLGKYLNPPKGNS